MATRVRDGTAVVRPRERRTDVLSVRLAPTERQRLEHEARSAGYVALSEFVRDVLAVPVRPVAAPLERREEAAS